MNSSSRLSGWSIGNGGKPAINELLGHRWDTNSHWCDFVQRKDLLSLDDKRSTLIETLDAMALDADALPIEPDPRSMHHEMLRFQKLTKDFSMNACWHVEEECYPTSAASTQCEGTSSKSMPARRPHVTQLVSKQAKLGELSVVDASLPAPWKKHRDILPVSWMAAQKATSAFECFKCDSIVARYDWYVEDELRKDFWGQHLTHGHCLGTSFGELNISSWNRWKFSTASTLSMPLEKGR